MSHVSKMPISASLGMPDPSRYSALAELLHKQHPTISIVILCGEREELLGALQSMLGGRINVFAEIIDRDEVPPARPDDKPPAISQPDASASDLALTERQLDVLELMMQGNSNKAICRVLNLAQPTVKQHVTAILRALKVSNRTEAVIAAGRLGWKLSPPRNWVYNRATVM